MGRIRRLVAALATAVTLVGAVPAPAVADRTSTWTPTSTGTLGPAKLGGVVRASVALARAKEWTTQPGTTYSQSGGWADNATGGPYRRDCSGFVSMAWGLTASLNTSGFDGWSGKTYLGAATALAYERLRPADALLGVDYGHIALFDRWSDTKHTRMWVYEETGTGHIAEHNEVARSWFTARGFRPIHYDRLRQDLAADPAGPVLAYRRGVGVAFYGWASTGSAFRHAGTVEAPGAGPIAVGDFDGGGHDEVATAVDNADGSTTVDVLIGGVAASWYTGYPFDGDAHLDKLVAGDFDGDGRADVAMFATGADGHLSIERFLSTGSDFNIPTRYDTTLRSAAVGGRIAAGDTDGDGTADLVAAPQRADGTWSFRVFAGAATPGVTWHSAGRFDLGTVGDRLVVGDFDGDGRAEPAMVAVGGDGTLTIGRFMSTGDAFDDNVSWHGTGSAALVTAGDADGDGADDLVVAAPNADGTFDFRVFRNATNPAGTWYTSGPFTLGNADGRIAMAAG